MASALLALLLVLHILGAFRWGLDSDEWQHLHVAWAWSQGFLEYRDLFDNHVPLFHILSAPVVAFIGETPNILFYMRLVILPLTLTTIACSALIGLALGGRRAALWTPVVLTPVSVFFFRSIEYRADALWAVFCVGAVATMVTGSARPLRAFAAGLLLGLACATSLKTVLFLLAIAVGLLLMPLVAGRVRSGAPLLNRLRLLPLLVAGILIPPALLVLYFAHEGALQAMYQATVRHNLLSGLGTWEGAGRYLLFFPEFAFFLAIAAWLSRRPGPAGRARRIVFVTLTAGMFLSALQDLWPLYTTYDLLVFYPLVIPILVSGMVGQDEERFTHPRDASAGAWRFVAVGLLLVGYLALEYAVTPPALFDEVALIAETLKLTDPNDIVLDQKGDTIFRRRPTYYIMERLTTDRFKRGLIPEQIQEDVIASGTCVAAGKFGLYPDRTRKFLEENFLPVGHLLIAGRFLGTAGSDTERAGQFDITIPARYAIVAESGSVQGLLDDTPYTGPRVLGAGRHTYKLSFEGKAAVLWAKAAERGFLPFDSSAKP